MIECERAGGHGLPQAQSESSAPLILEMRSLGVGRPILIGLAPCATETIAMTAQPLYAALDVSLEKTTVCVMCHDGTIIQEAVVPSDPAALAACLAQHRGRLERIGLEAGPLSEWIVRGLVDQGFTAILMETRQVGPIPTVVSPAAI